MIFISNSYITQTPKLRGLPTVFLEYDLIKSIVINCGIFYIMWKVIVIHAIFETL